MGIPQGNFRGHHHNASFKGHLHCIGCVCQETEMPDSGNGGMVEWWNGMVEWIGMVEWTGMMEWNSGMEWWNGMVEWNGGMEWWKVEWNGGMDWNSGMEGW